MRYWIFAALVLLLSIVFRDFGQQQHHSTSLSHQLRHPFDSRVHYRIGQIDPQFNLTETELIELAAQAANIWHQGTEKTLFVYDPKATLSIHLRFDERQLTANLQRHQEQRLQQQRDAHQDNSESYRQQRIQLAQQRAQLDRREADLIQQFDHYNRSITHWNTLGNLDDFNREQLRQKKQWLDRERQEVRQAVTMYNQQVNALNQMAGTLNQMNDHYNQAVDSYKARFVPRQFEKGHFDGREITIYEFSSPADLRLTIAHELGHALGLGHNDDPYALMYPVLKQQDLDNFRLTTADKALLGKR